MDRLRALGFPTYAAYTQSARWKARRAQWRKRHEWRCGMCDATKRLELHHLTYERVGNERDEDLAALCLNCHRLVHAALRAGAKVSREMLRDAKRRKRGRMRRVTKADYELGPPPERGDLWRTGGYQHKRASRY